MMRIVLCFFYIFFVLNKTIFATDGSGTGANGTGETQINEIQQHDVDNKNDEVKTEQKAEKKKNSFFNQIDFKLSPSIYYNITSENVDASIAFLWNFSLFGPIGKENLWFGVDTKYYNLFKINKNWVNARSKKDDEFGWYKNIADIIIVLGARSDNILNKFKIGVSLGLGVGFVRVKLYNSIYGGGVKGIKSTLRLRFAWEFLYRRFYVRPEISYVYYAISYTDNDGNERIYAYKGRSRISTEKSTTSIDLTSGGRWEFSVGFGAYLF